MDKYWMIRQLKCRIEELRVQYKLYVSNIHPVTGKTVSDSYAAVQRSRIKRDSELCELILLLLESSKTVFISNPKAIAGFTKLVEPNLKPRLNEREGI